MPRVLTTCPTTRETVPTIRRMQRPAFELVRERLGFRCSRCGEVHTWDRETAWLEDA